MRLRQPKSPTPERELYRGPASALRRMYVPDLKAHGRHDEKVLFAAHPADFHVWVWTVDGQVCSFCGRIQDAIKPKPETPAEVYPLFLTLPAGEAA